MSTKQTNTLGSEAAPSFEYLHLRDVDPNFNFKLADEGVYGLKVMKIEMRTPKGGGNQYVSARIAITDDSKASGVNIFERFFGNAFHQKALRKLADVTGIQQEPTESFASWLEKVSEIQPTFRSKVLKKQQEDVQKFETSDGNGGVKTSYTRTPKVDDQGAPVFENTVSWKDAAPAM